LLDPAGHFHSAQVQRHRHEIRIRATGRQNSAKNP
jgi:hypothetical protein